MLLFRSEEHVARWAGQRGLPRGGLVTLDQLWGLALAWHRGRLSAEWRRPSPEEAQAIFEGLGLTGEFWRLA